MSLAVPFPHGWTPQGEPSLLWWLDAADLTTITRDGSDLVSAWVNKAPPTFGDLAQATGADQPTWLAAGLNGRPCIEFSRKRMLGTFTHTGPDTIILFLGTLFSGGDGSGIIMAVSSTGAASNQAGGANLMRHTSAIGLIDAVYAGTAYGQQSTPFTVPFLFTNLRSATATGNYLNGGNPFFLTTAITTDFDRCALGASITFAGALGTVLPIFRVSEILAFASGNAALQQKAEAYLAWRWGVTLAAGHSWKQRAP